MLFLLSVLAVAVLCLSLWLAVVQREHRQFLMDQLSQKDQTIQQQTNLLLSRDPMTLASLQAVTSQPASPSEPYYAMTDSAEAVRWAGLTGGVGDEIIPQDLAELGLER